MRFLCEAVLSSCIEMIDYFDGGISLILLIALVSSMVFSKKRPKFEEGDQVFDDRLSERTVDIAIPLISSLYVLQVIFCYFRAYGADLTLSVWAPKCLGVFMVCSGVILREWAKVELGKFFTFPIGIRLGHTLIQTGPYTFIRHPSYTGHLLTSTGLLLYSCMCCFVPSSRNNWWWTYGPIFLPIAMFAVHLNSVFAALPTEEKMLSKAFLKEWPMYIKIVKWRVVPLLW